jgi:hypothetical protein
MKQCKEGEDGLRESDTSVVCRDQVMKYFCSFGGFTGFCKEIRGCLCGISYSSAVNLCCACAGLGAPLIVPPIRNAMNRPEPIAPPKLADVRVSLQLAS